MGKKKSVLTEYGIILWDKGKPQEEQWQMAPKWPDKSAEKQERYMQQKISEGEFEAWAEDSSNFEVTPPGLHSIDDADDYEDEDYE